jgi:hypothetical protein
VVIEPASSFDAICADAPWGASNRKVRTTIAAFGSVMSYELE